MNNDNAPTVEELIAEARRQADSATCAKAAGYIHVHSTFLVQLADALEQQRRDTFNGCVLTAAEIHNLRQDRNEARAALKETEQDAALIGRQQRRINRQIEAMKTYQADLAEVYETKDRYKAALEAITVDSEYMAYRIAQQALRPVDAPSMDEKLEILDRVAGSWKDRPSEHDCWDLDDKTTCGLCEQFQTPACEHEWVAHASLDRVCSKCGDVK